MEAIYNKLQIKMGQKIGKWIRYLRGNNTEYSNRIIEKTEIVEDLSDMGIQSGDIVYVKSSFKNIGKVEGGAESVIDALIEAVGTEGTIVMPAFSMPIDGMVETFRKRSGVLRSIHPAISVCAFGPKAKTIIERYNKSLSNYGVSTPLYKTLENGGKNIGIGIDFSPLSIVRVIEDVNPEVAETRVDKRPQGDWIRNLLTEVFIDKGILKYGYIGNAKSWIMDTKEFYDTYEQLLNKNITVYTTKEEYMKQKTRLVSYILDYHSAYSNGRYNYLKEQILHIQKGYQKMGFWDPSKNCWIRQLNWTGNNWSGFEPHDWKYAIELQEGATHYALITGESYLDENIKHELNYIHSKIENNGMIEGVPDGMPYSSKEYEYGATLSCLSLGYLYFKNKDTIYTKQLINDINKVYNYMSSEFHPLFEDHRSVILRGYANLMIVYEDLGNLNKTTKLKLQIEEYANEFIKNQSSDGLFPFNIKGGRTALHMQLKADIALLLSYKATRSNKYYLSAKNNFDWVINNLLLPNGGVKWNDNNSKDFFEIHQMLFLICCKYLTDLSDGKHDYTSYAILAWKFLVQNNYADIDMYVHNYRKTGSFFSYRYLDHKGNVQPKETHGSFKGAYELGYTLWALSLYKDDLYL